MLKIQVPGKYIFAIHISNRSYRTLTKSEKEPTYQFGSITQLFHKIQYSNSRVLSTEVVWVEGMYLQPSFADANYRGPPNRTSTEHPDLGGTHTSFKLWLAPHFPNSGILVMKLTFLRFRGFCVWKGDKRPEEGFLEIKWNHSEIIEPDKADTEQTMMSSSLLLS